MTKSLSCPDSWLTGCLGCPAYHLTVSPTLQHEDLPAGPAFVDAKVGVDSIIELQRLEAMGFRLVDTNVELTRDAAPLDLPTGRCRFATPDDEIAVRAIAARTISQSRFHLDPNISNATACHLKSAWAGNFFSGQRGEWMVVAEDKGEVGGFLQLLRRADNCIVIDLMAVAKERQGQGLATAMISYASQACLGRPTNMIVGTQMANLSSLALYNRLGFAISGATYVLHLHVRNGNV